MPVWGSFRLRHQPVHTQCSRHAHGPVLACRHSRTPMLASSTHTLAARRPLSLHNQAPRHSRRQQRHRCHSRPCHASASPSDPVPDLSHIQPHQRPEPGGWDTIQHLSVWRRLLSKGRQALSLAVLAACAFLALLLPSTAWAGQRPQPIQPPVAFAVQASVGSCQGQTATQAEQASSQRTEAVVACTEADAPASSQQAGSELQSLQPRGARDTGIQLAAADKKDKKDKDAHTDADWAKQVKWAETGPGDEIYPDDAISGFWSDPRKSLVPNPKDIPMGTYEETEEYLEKNPDVEIEEEDMPPMSLWRPDKMRDLTYTQFWELVRERQIDSAQYTLDRRSLKVHVKETAPGGERWEKVGLPFDPDLFDHMVEHGVAIKDTPINPYVQLVDAMTRFITPLWMGLALIMVSYRFGQKKERTGGGIGKGPFTGITMDRVDRFPSTAKFSDIAGIDQVKSEIMELVTFLRDPDRFLRMGARTPAGVLLCGAPGTGKTLLAKAMAGEAGVPFFSVSGSEFFEIFAGVGASRVRDMFKIARKNAPCVIFMDEFDGLGKQREGDTSGPESESVHTINALLTEMDGFEDNTGVVVMAATNRPEALDGALIRAGRFDRTIEMPMPDVEGRKAILKVHSRNKKIAQDVDMFAVAQATAGYTGAELMNLMNKAAILAVRQGREVIKAIDIYESIENEALEVVDEQNETAEVPFLMRRQIAVYEAGRAMLAWMHAGLGYDVVTKIDVSPHLHPVADTDDLHPCVADQVSCCPNGVPTGYTLFLPGEEQQEARVLTRAQMEAQIVVSLAGRCAERLVFGEDRVSTSGSDDVLDANYLAREMVYRFGFNKRLGPVALMDDDESYVNNDDTGAIASIGSELSQIAVTDVAELVEGAEAKACWGLKTNWQALQAVTELLMFKGTITGKELRETLQEAGATAFSSGLLEGWSWSSEGYIAFEGSPLDEPQHPSDGANGAEANGAGNDDADDELANFVENTWNPRSPYSVRLDLPQTLLNR